MILSSPVKDLSLLKDGILSAIPAGKPLPGKVGLNELLLTAPGHGIRKLRFWLKAGEQKTLEVALQKTVHPVDPVWESPERLIAPLRLGKLPSICVGFRAKAKGKGTELCHRETWLEDVVYAEPGLFPLEDLQHLAASKDLSAYRSLISSVFDTRPEITEKIEDFYTRRGQLGAVKRLAALHNLFRGDCPRVHALYVEAIQVLEDPSPLALYKGLCAELRQKSSFFEDVFRATKAPAPYLSYHYARTQLLTAPAKAQTLMKECLNSHRFDLPCQELGLMAAELSGNKDFKVQKFTIEDGAFRALLNLEAAIPKKQFEAAFFAVVPLLSSYPQSLESYLLLSWINAAEKLPGGSSYFERKFKISSPVGGSTLEKLIEILEKNEMAELLIPVYRLKINRDPSDPNLWIRLIRAQAKAAQCRDVLASLEAGAQVLPRYNAPVLQIQAGCLVEMGRLQEALDAYQKILELKPSSWSSFYNLGVIYEGLKRQAEAVQAFKKALEFETPPEVRDDIQYRLLALEKEKEKETGEGDPKSEAREKEGGLPKE